MITPLVSCTTNRVNTGAKYRNENGSFLDMLVDSLTSFSTPDEVKFIPKSQEDSGIKLF